MKMLPLFFAVLGGLTARALPPSVAFSGPGIDLVFQAPDNYSDIRDGLEPTDKGRMAILDEFRRALFTDARWYVPAGDRLAITFTDIRLAGDFEPWHSPFWDNVRIVKDVYFPWFKFSYRLTDPSGRVLKQGTEDIKDMNFMMRPVLDMSDPLRFEKDILRDWMREHIRT